MTKKSLARRAVMEHGPISNILPRLPLVNLVLLGHMHSRTYEKTVPDNLGYLEIPRHAGSIFPKIDVISDGFICKRTETFIEGE